MIPDIELQLQVVIKSLKDNVLPAVDGDNELAQQQIQLSLATLQIVSDHLPLVHLALRQDLLLHTEMAEKLLAICTDKESVSSLPVAIKTAKSITTDPSQGFVQLQQQSRVLREVIGQVIANNADSDNVAEIEKIVFAISASTLSLSRAWAKPLGFEPDPSAVVDLADQLDAL